MTQSPSSPQPRYAAILIPLPGFFAGVHSSVGMPSGGVVFGAFAVSGVIAVLLDRITPSGDEGHSSPMAAFLGVGASLAGLAIGFGLGNFVDYIRAF